MRDHSHSVALIVIIFNMIKAIKKAELKLRLWLFMVYDEPNPSDLMVALSKIRLHVRIRQ